MADADFDESAFVPDKPADGFDESAFVPEPVSGNPETGQTPQAVARGGASLDPSMAAAQQAAYNGPKHPDVDAALQTAQDFAGELGSSAAGQAQGVASHVWNATVAPLAGAAAGNLALLRGRSPEAGDAAAKAWTDKASWHPNSVYAQQGDKMAAVPGEIISRTLQGITTPDGMRAADGWLRERFGDHFVDQQENQLRAMHPDVDQYMSLLQQTPRATAVVKAALGPYAGAVGRNLQAAATLAGGASLARGALSRAWGGFEGEPTGTPEPAESAPQGGPKAPEVLPEDQPVPTAPSTPPPAPAAQAPAAGAPPAPAAPAAAPMPSRGVPRSMFPLPAEEGNREGAPPLSPQDVDARAALLQRAMGASLPEVHTSVLSGDYTETGNDVATARASNADELRKRSTDLVANATTAMDSKVADMSGGADASSTATKARSQDVADAMTALNGHLDRHIQMVYDAKNKVGGTIDAAPLEQWMNDNKWRFDLVDAGKTLWTGTMARLKQLKEAPGGFAPQQAEALRKSLVASFKPETGHLIRGSAGVEGMIPTLDGTVAKSLGDDVYAAARAVRAKKGELIDNDKSLKRFAPGPDSDNPEVNRAIPSEQVLDKLLGSGTSTPQFQAYFDSLKNGRDFLAKQGDQEGADDMTARIGRAYDAARTEVGAQAHAAGSTVKGWNQQKFASYLQSVESKMATPGDTSKGLFSADRMARWKDLVDAGNILKYDKEYKGAVAQGVQVKGGAGQLAGNFLAEGLTHAANIKTGGVSTALGGGHVIRNAVGAVTPGMDTTAKALARYNQHRVTDLTNYRKRAP